jgi:hypothetical protein
MAFKIKENLSVVATLAVILITTIVGYYVIGLKKAPYPVSSMQHFTFKWGTAEELENTYASSNGEYHYLDNRDSLIKKQVKLRSNDMIFIHNKANELGLWKLPDVIGKPSVPAKSPTYELAFYYRERQKKITVYSGYEENPQLLDSAMQLIKIVQQTIDQAEGRYH